MTATFPYVEDYIEVIAGHRDINGTALTLFNYQSSPISLARYDVNIVGIRNNAPSVADKITNVFDDLLTISFFDEKGVEQFYSWMATTDPGKRVEWAGWIRGWCRLR